MGIVSMTVVENGHWEVTVNSHVTPYDRNALKFY